MSRFFSVLCVSCLAALLSSCASTSLFKSYNSQINPHIASVERGNCAAPLAPLAKTAQSSNDAVLYHLERARIAQIGGDIEQSKSGYEAAMDCFKVAEERAVISASRGASEGASLLTNDAAIPYDAKGYEKVFGYQEQALNYLFGKDLEGAAVEVRRANEEQKLAVARHDKEIAKADKELKEQMVSTDSIYSKNYAALNEIEGKVKNSFMNAYSHYMCGTIQEIGAAKGGSGGMTLNDAYIDYKKTLEIYPDNSSVQRDALRLARLCGMNDDLAQLKTRFPAAAQQVDQSNNGDCTVVVLYEDGWVPQMSDLKVPVPTPNGLLTMDLPYYRIDAEPLAQLEVRCNEQPVGSTEVICDVRALAVKNLKERFGGIVLREVLRTAAMAAGQNELKKKSGDTGALIGSIIDLALSRADTRAWYTLPRYVQVLKFNVPHGNVRLAMASGNLAGPLSQEFSTDSSNYVVVRVVRTGRNGMCHMVQY
jgi:hypothetical protein